MYARTSSVALSLSRSLFRSLRVLRSLFFLLPLSIHLEVSVDCLFLLRIARISEYFKIRTRVNSCSFICNWRCYSIEHCKQVMLCHIFSSPSFLFSFYLNDFTVMSYRISFFFIINSVRFLGVCVCVWVFLYLNCPVKCFLMEQTLYFVTKITIDDPFCLRKWIYILQWHSLITWMGDEMDSVIAPYTMLQSKLLETLRRSLLRTDT